MPGRFRPSQLFVKTSPDLPASLKFNVGKYNIEISNLKPSTSYEIDSLHVSEDGGITMTGFRERKQ